MGRILVIEDEQSTQHMLRSRLRELGHDVTVKETGAQGITEAKTSSFDLYLIDMHLGDGVDGIEVCRRMKRDPETRNVPVVLLSGKIRGSEDLHRGYEAGCESFMVKNDMSLVEDVIRAMLRIKSLGDELSTQMALLQQRNEHLQQALEDKAKLEDQLARTSDGGAQRGGQPATPDGVLLVDHDGTVNYADRGAREIFAKRIEGRNLGNLAPGTRLEAFVRDARTVPRSGFRFSVSARGGRPAQHMVATVLPLVPTVVGQRSDMLVVLLHDERRGQIESELLEIAARGMKLEEVADLRELARREYRPSRLIGKSPVIAALRERALEIAGEDNPLLISGEAGTGKRHLARVLHFSSNRTGAFVPVSFEALGRDRIEAELFGDEDHPSLILQASGGTLFLEGIEKLNQDVQARLARVFQAQSIDDPSTGKRRDVHVRLIASTLAPIDSGELVPALRAMFSGQYELPRLRERGDDIALLSRAFLDRHGLASGSVDFTEDAWLAVRNYEWPGNLAELDSALAAACAALGEGSKLDVEHLPPPLPDCYARLLERAEFTPSKRPDAPVRGTHQPALTGEDRDGKSEFVEDAMATLPPGADEDNCVSFEFFEKWALYLALLRTEGDRLKAAKLLKVGKSTLYRKLNKYEIH